MKTNQKRQFYIYLALVALLLLCLFHMPYGFYTLVRFLAMVAFAYLAYLEFKSKNIDRMVVFIALAVLFQPFVKMALGRTVWNIVDVAVACYLLYLSFKTYKK